MPSDVSISSTGSFDTAGFEAGLDAQRRFNAYWEYSGQRMQMNINKFETTSGGKMHASGADCNGTFVVRGKVDPFMLSFQATKMYPDHCLFVWG